MAESDLNIEFDLFEDTVKGKAIGTPTKVLVVEKEEDEASENTTLSATEERTPRWHPWYEALKATFPVYLAVHLGILIATVYAAHFKLKDYSLGKIPTSTLWLSWLRWDTGWYLGIAKSSYTRPKQTAFFPLYPMLTRLVMFVIHTPVLAGLVVSNILGLGLLVVLYRLVKDDFGADTAQRTILYLALFPTAFFLAAAYSETTFLFLTMLLFYNIRKGNWWIAGLCGLLASLSRTTGLLLVVPFFFEYLAQHGFTFKRFPIRKLRLDILAGVLIPMGTGLFMLYCYHKFNDPLAFSTSEHFWGRKLQLPWWGIFEAMREMYHSVSLINFVTLHNLLDLVPVLLVLTMIVLMFVGPWRLEKNQWTYAAYAITVYLLVISMPITGDRDLLYPLQSQGRYMLAVFPAFIILAKIGKNKFFNINYLVASGSLLFILLSLFLTGHWFV